MSRIAIWIGVVFLLVSAACGGSAAVTEEPAVAESQTDEAPATEPTIPPAATSEPTAPPAGTESMPTSAPPGAEPVDAATAGQGAPTNGVGPVKIAVIDSLQLSDGRERADWARLAVEDFNAATGWNVELVEIDAGVDSAAIMTSMDAVLSDPAIYAAIGPHRAGQIAAAGAMSAMVSLPHIVFSGYPALAQAGFFRLSPTDDLQGAAAANFIVETLGAHNVAAIVQSGQGSPGVYGYELFNSFNEALGAAGGAVVAMLPIEASAADFSELASTIQAGGADAVFAADTSAAQGAQIVQALQAAGVQIPLVGHYGWADALLTESGAGVYVLSPAPAVAEGGPAERYRSAHGAYSPYGPLAYAATMAALEAMQRAAEAGQLSRAAVSAEIAATRQTDTILGTPITFTSDGNWQNAQFYLLQVQDGAFKTVAP